MGNTTYYNASDGRRGTRTAGSTFLLIAEEFK
jgi:hypothetical protein